MAYIGIVTRYLAPTDTKGARIVATTSIGKRIVRPLDYALNTRDAHRSVALAAVPFGFCSYLQTSEWSDHYSHMIEVP
jgi:hypothetical protein